LGGRIVGRIEVGRLVARRQKRLSAYTKAEEQVLLVVQSQIGLAFQRQALQLKMLQQSKQALTVSHIFRELDLAKSLDVAVEKIPALCAARGCSIFLWDTARQAFVLQSTTGLRRELIGRAYYRRGEGLTGWVGEGGKPLRLRNRTAAELGRVDPTLRWKG